MTIQKRFARGLKNGLMMHLKLKGLWDLYRLTPSNLDLVFNEPIEHEEFRRAKQLETKINMLEKAIGSENVAKVFSTKFALKYFMGWDEDRIRENERMRFEEQVKAAREEGILEKVKDKQTLDLAGEDSAAFEKPLKKILQDGLTPPDEKKEEGEGEEGGDSGGGGDDGGFGF